MVENVNSTKTSGGTMTQTKASSNKPVVDNTETSIYMGTQEQIIVKKMLQKQDFCVTLDVQWPSSLK